MLSKKSIGLSMSSEFVRLIDSYASSKAISRSNAVEQLILLSFENMNRVTHIEKEMSASLNKFENRLKNEVNRLAKLQIHQLRLSAVIKGFILFHLDNTLHVDANTIKTIEDKSIQRIMETLKNGE
jgi:hypothetical protein